MQSMMKSKSRTNPIFSFPRTLGPLTPSLTIPVIINPLPDSEPSSASCISISSSCISLCVRSTLSSRHTPAPFRPLVTIPSISRTLPNREPTSASRVFLSAFAEALYYSGVSDCVPCPIAFRFRVPSAEHWRPQRQARIRELFGICLEPPECVGDLDPELDCPGVPSDADWSSVEIEIFEERHGDLSLDDQLAHLRRLYDIPEGLEARKRRHVGKKDAIAALLAALMSEL